MTILRRALPLLFLALLAQSQAAEFSPRIVGGTVSPSAPSWMAALLYSPAGQTPTYYCAGALISSQWVVTAAHCVASPFDNPSQLRLVIGERDLSQVREYRRVDRILQYPGWDTTTFEGDIAVLHLETNAPGSPLPLAGANDAERLPLGTPMRAYGWGTTVADDVTGEAVSDLLRQVDLPFLGFSSLLAPDHFLAGGEAGRDVCFGDSGGPLIYQGVLYGITSFGVPVCAQAGLPSAFTAVGHHLAWLQATTGVATARPSSSGSGGGGMDFMLLILPLLLWWRRQTA